MNSLTIKIITPAYNSVIEDVSSINLKGISGEMTILPSHYPLITAIDVSVIKLMKNKLPILAFASNGMMYVKEEEIVLVLNAFEFKDEIDLNRAKASYERAYQRIQSSGDGIDLKRAEAALKRAITRINLVEGK